MSFLWDKLLRPLAFGMDAEHAHELGLKTLTNGLAAPFYTDDVDPILSCERFGLSFRSPLGIAAGFDNNGLVVEPLSRLGFGFVEVGTVTARPQPGNPKPRLFRLAEDKALINRLGFNNDGAAVVAERLARLKRRCMIGVNIGRNKDVTNDAAVDNYLEAFSEIWSVADYIVVNVSSPNTPGLRDLQQGENLDDLISALQEKNRGLGAAVKIVASEQPPNLGKQSTGKPLLVKIAPDLNDREIESVVEVALRHDLAGIIATNTTVSRDGLKADTAAISAGGLSGAPLRELSTDIIRQIYKLTDGRMPIVGVGGIFTSEDAFEKIAAGASLIQAYTGFIYGGPSFPATVNNGLARLLRERGFSSIDEAVGTAHR
ncbi:MAG: quinone-dependent dihydroorotate dehydrogenase [Pyrinomonadaceae bacterium]